MPVTNTACGICDGLFVSITSKIEGGVFRETYWSLDKICKIKYVIYCMQRLGFVRFHQVIVQISNDNYIVEISMNFINTRSKIVCTWRWGQIGCVQCVYMGLGSDRMCTVCVHGTGVRSDVYSVCIWGWGQIGCDYSLTYNVTPRLK